LFSIRTLAGQQPKTSQELATDKGFVCGVMGLPDAGKTSLIHDLMTHESCYPVAFLNCGGGAHVINNEFTQDGRIQIYNTVNWQEAERQAEELRNDPKPFKTLWVDVANVYADLAIDYFGVHDVPRNDARGRQQTYGESNWDTVLFHRKIIDDLATAKGINVFFVYWETYPVVIEGSGSVVKKRHILLSPTLAVKIAGLLDVLIHIEQEQGLQPWPPNAIFYGNQGVDTRWHLAPTNPLKKLWPPSTHDPKLSRMVRAFHGEEIGPHE
jgi:hypothetical protein